MIQGGVSKDDLNEYSLFVLVNAIYFKAKWMDEFDERSTRDDTFYTPQGNVTVPMMNQWSYVNYGEGERLPGRGNSVQGEYRRDAGAASEGGEI